MGTRASIGGPGVLIILGNVKQLEEKGREEEKGRAEQSREGAVSRRDWGKEETRLGERKGKEKRREPSRREGMMSS